MPSLSLDGLATPHQIALFVPLAYSATATATMKYRRTGVAAWTTGHNLHQIRASWSLGTPTEGFAWTIFDLDPATSYDVSVTVTDGGDTEYTNTFVTRTLPPAAGSPTITISPGDNIQTKLDSAEAGSVIQFADGTYDMTGVSVTCQGTALAPVYIRGATKTGAILDCHTKVIDLHTPASYLVIENLTLRGSQVNSGSSASSIAVYGDADATLTQITIRDCIFSGVDVGFIHYGCTQALIYNNVITGNNTWTEDDYGYGSGVGYGEPGSETAYNETYPLGTPDIDESSMWNDDGISLMGNSNCAFHNTISGFGDSFTIAHTGTNYSLHYYKNDILMGGDDGVEADYGMRNVTFYDNRVHNSMTLLSCDPIYGGPFIAARNIGINIGRTPFKFGDANEGVFVYNNTIIRANWGATDPQYYNYGWIIGTSSAQAKWAIQNNIIIYDGTPTATFYSPGGAAFEVDFSYNSWYPDGVFEWSDAAGASLAAAQADMADHETVPVFGASALRHYQDNICERNPFANTVTFGANHHTEITAYHLPFLRTATAPKQSGVEVVGITDGYIGSAPDRGALIEGRPIPNWGATFNAVDTLVANTWMAAPLSRLYSDHWPPGDGVLPDTLDAPDFNPPGGFSFIMTDWSGGTFDYLRGELLIFGGGHGNYGGNEIYGFNLSTLAWRRVWGPTGNIPGAVEDPPQYYDTPLTPMGPLSRHSYNLNVYIPRLDCFMNFGGVLYSTGGNVGSTNCWRLNLWGTPAWTEMAELPAGITEHTGTAYDPLTGYVYLVVGKMWEYDPVANTFTLRSNSPVTGNYMTFTIDTKRNRMIGIGGGAINYWQLGTPGLITRTDPTTTGQTAIQNGAAPGVAYDPISDRLIAWDDGRNIYSLNMDTWEWTSRIGSGSNPGNAAIMGTYGRFAYDQSRKACVVVNDVGAYVYIYSNLEPSLTINPPNNLRLVR